MKSAEVGALREQTLSENRDVLLAAARELRARLEAGGKLLAMGNGGSATDAADFVADLRHPEPMPDTSSASRPGVSGPVEGWPARRAIDLTEDSSIITAIANDIGTDEIFQRQVIAYGTPGDVAVALSTSGNSRNLIAALGEARKRGLATVAMVGYDGGRIAAERLADHVIVSRSQHIPRIQEAQASAYHALRELIELAAPG
jgi:D-sedoheptulose 7-phosphate isomerase